MSRLATFIRGVGRQLRQTQDRFPVPVALVAALFVVVLGHIHSTFYAEGDYLRVEMALVCMWIAALAGCLLGEGRGWDEQRKTTLSVLALAVIAVLFTGPHYGITFAFLLPACLVALAPYLGRPAEEKLSCHYNTGLLVNAFFTGAATLILLLGLNAVLATVETLFALEIPEEVFGDVSAVITCLFAPLYFLTQMKPVTEQPEEIYYPKGVAFIVGYILSPLLLTYAAIFYAYVARIALQGELPQGKLAYMVAAFGAIGVATQLFSAPLVARGMVLPMLIDRWFFRLLWVPVGLLMLAIGVRVAQYGVTEERYAVMLAALWLGFTAVYMTVSQAKSLRVVLASLSLMLFLASFGPWGAVAVSTYSQQAALRQLLERNGLMVEGRVRAAKDPGAVSFEDSKQISSRLDYFMEHEKFDAIRPWFPFGGAAYSLQPDHSAVSRIMEYDLRLKYVSRWQDAPISENAAAEPMPESPQKIPFTVQGPSAVIETESGLIGNMTLIDTAEFDTVLAVTKFAVAPEAVIAQLTPETKLHFDTNAVLVTREASHGQKATTLRFDLGALYAQFYADKMANVPEEEKLRLFPQLQDDRLAARLLIDELIGYMEDGEPHVTHATFHALVVEKGKTTRWKADGAE